LTPRTENVAASVVSGSAAALPWGAASGVVCGCADGLSWQAGSVRLDGAWRQDRTGSRTERFRWSRSHFRGRWISWQGSVTRTTLPC